jgi:alkylhydroperoxidase family enzyme
VRAHLSETELIELCMLVGHYEMLAMTINSLGIEPEAEPEPAR